MGFLLAMFLIFSKVGPLDYLGIFANKAHLPGGTATAAVLLLFLAATGKSAQIPLFNWLPDAMEGPTPVSALIHAATMVTAGVYLLCRMSPILALSPTPWTIAIIGAATAFVAATIATAQQDIKKVLAFSTVSQIGYMILAVGSGAYTPAIFLMVAHAFYKALLVPGGGFGDPRAGGRAGPQAHGAAAQVACRGPSAPSWWAGWPSPGSRRFSGFWSKGDILDNVFATATKPLWVIGLVTALLTAYYMTRLFFLTFYGEARWRRARPDGRPAHHAPHESPWVMRIPLSSSPSALAFVGGLHRPADQRHRAGSTTGSTRCSPAPLQRPRTGGDRRRPGDHRRRRGGGRHGHRLDAVAGAGPTEPELEPAVPPAGLVLGRLLRRRHRPAGPALARFCATVVDGRVIDGAVNGVGRLARRAARRPGDCRPATSATTPWASPSAWPPSWSSCSRGRGGREPAGFPYLTVLVLLPAGGALVVALVASTAPRKVLSEIVALAVSLATLGCRRHRRALTRPATAATSSSPATRGPRLSGSAGSWASTASRCSWCSWPPCCSRWPSWRARPGHDPRAFMAWMLLLEAACIGSFISLDLILFFLFFELTLVPAYFLIGGWGHARRAYAAIKFFVYTFLGSAFLLVGILAVAFIHQRQTGVLPSRCRLSSTPTLGGPPRCCSSWPSPPPSPSRPRCSRCTPGRPTPTPRPRPAVR